MGWGLLHLLFQRASSRGAQSIWFTVATFNPQRVKHKRARTRHCGSRQKKWLSTQMWAYWDTKLQPERQTQMPPTCDVEICEHGRELYFLMVTIDATLSFRGRQVHRANTRTQKFFCWVTPMLSDMQNHGTVRGWLVRVQHDKRENARCQTTSTCDIEHH